MVNYNINLFFFKFNEQKIKTQLWFLLLFYFTRFLTWTNPAPARINPHPPTGRWPGGVSGSGWGVGSSGGLGSCQGAYGSCGVDSDCQVGGGGGLVQVLSGGKGQVLIGIWVEREQTLGGEVSWFVLQFVKL